MRSNDKIIRLGFLIFPGFPMSCLTSMIEPLRAANEIAEETAFSWEIVSETGDRVQSSAGVYFDPDQRLETVEAIDLLFLLSAPTSRFANPTVSNGVIRKLARHGATLGAVSAGVFPLARAGLLDGHKASIHWCYKAAFEAEFPDTHSTDAVLAQDGRRTTVSGASAAFDLSLHMIEDRLGAEISTEVACWFQHPMVRGKDTTQRVPTVMSESTNDMLPTTVRKSVDIFASHIEDPVKVVDVASIVGASPRHLERMFKKSTGQSPHQYYRSMRMKAARQMALYTNANMTEIAIAVGYSTAPPMIQNYIAEFGLHPNEDRKKINLFRVRDNAAVPAS
ncbi:MAG: GlxA family transcriptional regulator [Paracoccaceae bacterium]|nr:GlxA family transcriptional regulator [Paracoccaceae bacterium]MDG1739312.1 GlxA family transcriptional regulator [Paracoccaceae bacterium]MDG2260034.1 GlxA family transcriptional regulator [Paracoccaceae bacterium]